MLHAHHFVELGDTRFRGRLPGEAVEIGGGDAGIVRLGGGVGQKLAVNHLVGQLIDGIQAIEAGAAFFLGQALLKQGPRVVGRVKWQSASRRRRHSPYSSFEKG